MADEDISPEEKLLKVIQSSDEDAEVPAAVGEESPSAPETGQPEPQGSSTVVPESAKLKLASAAAQPAPPTSAPPVATETAEPAEAEPAEAEPVEPEAANRAPAAAPVLLVKHQAAGMPGVRIANLVLVAIALFMLAFAAMEIWGNVMARETPVLPRTGGSFDLPTAAPGADLPSLDKIIEAWHEKEIFGSEFVTPPGPNQTNPKPPPNDEIKKYVKNLNLVAISFIGGINGVREAIIVDNNLGKLQFLRVGDKLTVAEQELELREIHKDRVVLWDGTENIVLE